MGYPWQGYGGRWSRVHPNAQVAPQSVPSQIHTSGADGERRPEILFVCVHNAGRSQMAAGLVSLRSGGRVRVRSAGSDPGESVNPLAVDVMAELGVDLSSAIPRRLDDDDVRAAHVVVTMGCGDACPIYPGKRYEDWVVADPAEAESLDEVRMIRDAIDARVRTLLSELGVEAVPTS